jgi:hypothetical protein
MRGSSLPSLPSLLLVAAATAGCYRSPGVPVDHRAPLAAPAGPAPRLAWADHGFEASRLPAVSADGAAILIGIRDDDGGRGNPNYRLELRDRRDAKLAGQLVLAADEADAMIDADGKTAELDRRIAAANRWLEQQHAARGFVPLRPLEVEPGEEIASSFRATGGGVTVEWRPSRLTIAHGGQMLVDRATPTTWLVQDRPRPGDLPACHNPAYLGAAAVSLPHKVALLRIDYGGTDTCWEPNDQRHVVAW